VAGPNIGDWSAAAARLPGRRAAFEQWPANDDYVVFAQQQLELAQSFPTPVNGAVLDILRAAVVEVLNQTQSPLEAAEIAVAALTP
jgi:hypothetical protein